MQADLHFHLLPGVDDGPPDETAALALARAAVADGTSVVLCTPHVVDVVVAELPDRVEALRGLLQRHEIPLEVACGGELNVDDVPTLGAGELEIVAAGPEHARWVLLEPRFEGLGPLREAAQELRELTCEVVLAHPERAAALWANGAAALEDELARGALAQVSAGSLLGFNGPEARSRAWQLVRQHAGQTLVASDAHHAVTRPPLMRPARAALLGAGVDAGDVARMTAGTAERLLSEGLPRTERAGWRSSTRASRAKAAGPS